MLDLGRGNPEVGPPPHVVEALRECGRPPGRRTATRPFRGLRRLQRGDRRTLPRPLRRRHRPGARGRDRARDEDRDRGAGARGSRSAATRSCFRTRAIPTTRRASRSPARPARRAATRPRRPAGRPTSTPRPPAAAAVPQLPLEPVRGLRACPARTRPRSPTPSARAPRSSRDAEYIDLVYDGREPGELPRDAGRGRTWAWRCGRCRRRSAWPAGASASSSATPRSSSAVMRHALDDLGVADDEADAPAGRAERLRHRPHLHAHVLRARRREEALGLAAVVDEVNVGVAAIAVPLRSA